MSLDGFICSLPPAMPSRQPPSPSFPPFLSLSATAPPAPPPLPPLDSQVSVATQLQDNQHHISSRLIPAIAGVSASLIVLFCLAILFRKLTRKRTVPADLKPPQRFSYNLLRRATSSFSSSNRLGKGGFGSVYRGTLPTGQEIAVKVMDSGSLQGEREFQNELSLAGKIDCDRVVSLLGYSCDRKRRRMLLVYELMHNRSLQDALLDCKLPELMEWKKRFAIAFDIARGLEFLHIVCNPPVIHGDIKPSNILLDSYFSAKIADFGLARLKTEENCDAVVLEVPEGDAPEINRENGSKGKNSEINAADGGDENGSILEETDSVTTTCEDANVVVERSPDCFTRISDTDASPETTFFAEASPSEILDKTSVSEGYFDKFSVESSKDAVGGGENPRGRKKSLAGKDWWWRQENGGGASDSGSVKDYVMEWIGSEIKKDRPKSDWIIASAPADEANGTVSLKPIAKPERKKQRRMEWWNCLDEENVPKKEKNRQPREWWREEYCEELAKKNKRKPPRSRGGGSSAGELWWQKDEDLVPEKRKKNRGKRSRSSTDWWLDGLSGEFRNGGRRNSVDWASGEIPKSGGVSSTPSMRGTVCYIAPEYGGGGQLSEKCDVYSFGVLLLVLIAGRRPLQVTGSPMSEFERANLISWTRHLARTGKLLDLVDPSIQSLDREQALLCITIALVCLQRSPLHRPSMKDIVAMLSGESEPPHLPFEFSPSPPCNFPFKSRKQVR